MLTLTSSSQAAPTLHHPPDSRSLLYEVEFRSMYDAGYRVAYRILGSRDDAEDIASDALAKAWLRWSSISGYGSAWVCRASGNAAISLVRRRSLFERLALVSSSPAAVPSSELRADLVRALRQVSGRQRDVLVLRYVADLPEAEVAAVLGCSVGSVKTHAHRGLQALRTNPNLINVNQKEAR